MTESRTELLSWYNDLSGQGYTKIEQFGAGAGHCLIMDSIYRDVPMHKVKFNAKHEYEYVANFKILQAEFDKHKIENAIPVERLIKCKFQDNLEFLQWVKKFWDQYYPGGSYDAQARRKSLDRVKSATKEVKEPKEIKKTVKPRPAEKEKVVQEYQKVTHDMTSQVQQLKTTVEQVEKEREFYFSKLREIELYIQSCYEKSVSNETDKAFKEIQAIMYKTEDGFETPDAEVETY
ncbi:calponin homology domain-containing protein [Gorgonomyces haynaldii]|nr:calponin homology domain-containing protein [Gorgonomyces haynaldii]